MRKIALMTAFLALAAAIASAQPTIKVQAPNLVALDEQFNVTFIISGEDSPSSFSWSEGDDFQLVWGPQKGSSTSISIVNGKHTKSSQTTYTYVLLPKKTGKFALQQASATVKGTRITGAAHQIEVVSAGSSSSSSSSPSSSGSSAGRQGGGNTASTGDVSSEDIFLRLSLSKTSVVVGETVTATLKLYQRVNIAGFEDAKFPTFNGFWSQEVQAPSNIEFKRENVGGAIYNAAVLRSWTLIPQQAGDVAVEPAELVCLVNVRAPRTSTGSIFDSFFQDDYRTVRKRVTSSAYTVHVKPVPAGAPASFGGGVGQFRMSASVSRDSLSTHEAASLKVTLTGKGNIALLEAPKISFPPDFEVYDTKVTETASSKTFEYPFIPRSHGDFVLGPVEYSYYDVQTGKYVTLASDPMPMNVARGAEEAVAAPGGQILTVPGRKDVREIGSDVRYISTALPKFTRKGSFFAGSALFWILFALIILAAVALYFLLRGLAARKADVVGSKGRAATKMARRRLSEADSYLQKNLYSAFYEALHKALLGFVSDKFNMDASELSKDNIASRLAGKGVPEGVTADFISLLDACEFARYSPDAGHEAMNAHFEGAVSAISTIDECMKKKPLLRAGAAVLVLLLLAIPGRAGAAQPADSLWTAGVAAYEAGAWTAAAGAWTEIEESGLESPELYSNIGNAFFKNQEYGRAVLYYERALKLDPSCADARFNLAHAQAFVQDRIEEVPEFFLRLWIRSVSRTMPSGAWAALALVLLALAAALALLFALGRRSAARKTGFFGGLASLLLCVLCLAFAFGQRSERLSEDTAVVTGAVAPVKSAPGAGSAVDLFVLHEGTKVRVLEDLGDWLNIELSDGRQGWIAASLLEKV